MTSSLLSPRAVYTGMALSMLVTAVEAVLRQQHGRFLPLTPMILLNAAMFVPCLLSAWLAVRIAREHGQRSLMRSAWILIAAGSLCQACRFGYEIPFHAAGRIDSSTLPVLGLRQLAIAGSLLLLAAGLCAMWSSFAGLSLGLRLRPADLALMALFLLLVPPVVWSRFVMADAHSPFTVVRYLQFASPLLLAIPASIGVALYRVSREMGQGLLAVALRCIATSFAIRLVLLLFGALLGPAPGAGTPFFLAFLPMLLSIGAHWLFLLGLVYRCRVSRAAHQLIASYLTLGPGRVSPLPGIFDRI